MDSTYLDIVKRHLKNSYFADLFFSTKRYYYSNPMRPYKKEYHFSDAYQPLENHSSYLAHCLRNISLFFLFLCSIAFSHIAILIIAVLLIISLISGYWNVLQKMGDIFRDIFTYWNNISLHDIVVTLGYHIWDILFILAPIIIILGSSLFTYLKDKNKIGRHNDKIKSHNRDVYEQELNDRFLHIFDHFIALDNQRYIQNVMNQIDDNYQLFSKRELENETHTPFETQCLQFVSDHIKGCANQSNACVLLFSRLYQILSENEVQSFDDVEKIYHSYEEKGIFKDIKTVLHQRKYSPEYYPIIEYRILMEREFIISAIKNQKGFSGDAQNAILNEYKSLAS